MSFCQRHNFQVDKVPLENGLWIGGRQNLWLIASLMWQGSAVWGNWSALHVDTFCVLLSCRLLLAWPWGLGRVFYIADTTWSAPTFFFIVAIDRACLPAVANLLVNTSLKCPSQHFVPSHLLQAIFFFHLEPCSYLVQFRNPIFFNNQLLSCHLINTASLSLMPGIKHKLNTNQP